MSKTSDLKIKLPSKTPGAKIETPFYLPKLPSIFISTGQAGKGKTTATANLLRFFRENGCLDRLFIVSPTLGSNAALFREFDLPLQDEDIFDPNSEGIVQKIISEVEKERDEYIRYLEERKRYERLRKLLDGQNKTLVSHQMQEYTGGGIVTPRQGHEAVNPPKHKYNGKKPIIFVLLDDCQGTKIFKSRSQLGYMAIKHRHIGEFNDGTALGVSMVVNIQNWRERDDGCPRSIRSNAKVILVYFTKDDKEREAIAEEASGVTDKETLLDRLDKATAPFSPNFLLVDKDPKDPTMVFRRNFDEFMEPPPDVQQKELKQSSKKRRRGNDKPA